MLILFIIIYKLSKSILFNNGNSYFFNFILQAYGNSLQLFTYGSPEINDKDFSLFEFNYVKFVNCNFKNVSFTASTGYSLSFYNCQFDQVCFSKTDFIKINFQNCQLVNCGFGRTDLYITRYLNCQLEKVDFNAADLMDFKIENSQLLDVSFGGSEIQDLKITNSILKNIECGFITARKIVSKNGSLGVIKEIKIENYSSFLKEFVETEKD